MKKVLNAFSGRMATRKMERDFFTIYFFALRDKVYIDIRKKNSWL